MSPLATPWNVEQAYSTARQDWKANAKVTRMRISNSASVIDDGARRLGSQAMSLDGTFVCGILKDDVRAARARSHTTPWWFWWNILSFDAPTVAVVWALLLARPSHMRLRAADEIVLGLVVWCIYVSDRLFDGLKPTNQRMLRERHLFCAKHRRALTWLLVLAAVAALWVTADFLGPMEVKAGMKLTAIIGAYMATIHAGHGSIARFVPKEVAVGILFAIGTALPAWSRLSGFSWDAWIPFGLFAVLCSLNCLAIECWEDRPHYPDWYQSRNPVIRWAETRINQLAGALAASAFAVILVRRDPGPFSSGLLAISLAALLILLLNRYRNRLSGRALRVLADATLVLAGGLALVT